MDGEFSHLEARVNAALKIGMEHAVWAELEPDRIALYEAAGGRTRTFGDLNANANRIATWMRRYDLRVGDPVALMCSNRIEFMEVVSAALRAGLRLTPINWHLTVDEVAYILRNCEAKAFFAEARSDAPAPAAAQAPDLRLKVAIGGPIPGFVDYDAALKVFDGADIEDPVRGTTMLYTSGTTGRPKGVHRKASAAWPFNADYDRQTDRHIGTGPAYHAAPMGDLRRPLTNGVPVVMMDKWDAEETLRLIHEHRITHGHFVPTMFQRLLALPDDVKAKYDVSSLKLITHGAAPCPPEVKRAMIAWWGPVFREYYAGSEGGAGFLITSEEWLKKPGSVGRRTSPDVCRILDDAGNECPQGVAGTIYFRLQGDGFSYYKDPEKTHGARRGDYFTLGDVGYLDEDDYLFLTGRSAETIISGGVNIYPQEIDNQLGLHPAVADVCTIGAPNDEWGEEVKAVVQLAPGFAASDALKAEILAIARDGLAPYKVPRSIDFVDELPRSDAGKILRSKVRAPYWEGRERQI